MSYPQPQATVPPRMPGGASWALSFLMYIPGLGIPITIIVLAAIRSRQKALSPAADENNRRALNWWLTFVTWCIVLIPVIVLLGSLHNGMVDNGQLPSTDMSAYAVIAVTLLMTTMFGGGLLSLIFVIVGAVRASQGKAFLNRLQIPYLRARPDAAQLRG